MLDCLFITHSFGGGAERVLLTLLARLDRARFRPAVACLHPVPAWRTALPADVPCLMPEGRSLGARLRFWRKLRGQARQADVVIGSLELQSILAAVLLASGRAIGWVHKDVGAYLSVRSGWRRALYAALLRGAVHRCAQVVCVSDGCVQALAAQCPTAAQRVRRVYNPVPLEELRADAAAPMPPDMAACFAAPVVLAVGRLEHQKHFDLLLHAFHRMRQNGCDAHLCLVGEGSERAALEALRHALGLDDVVFLAGFRNPAPFMARARLCVLSSHFEGLPTVLIEALALGCPVVSMDCPSGPREVLENGRYGVLVPMDAPDLPEALAAAVTAALQAPDSESDRAARRQRAEDFAVGETVAVWEHILEGTATRCM